MAAPGLTDRSLSSRASSLNRLDHGRGRWRWKWRRWGGLGLRRRGLRSAPPSPAPAPPMSLASARPRGLRERGWPELDPIAPGDLLEGLRVRRLAKLSKRPEEPVRPGRRRHHHRLERPITGIAQAKPCLPRNGEHGTVHDRRAQALTQRHPSLSLEHHPHFIPVPAATHRQFPAGEERLHRGGERGGRALRIDRHDDRARCGRAQPQRLTARRRHLWSHVSTSGPPSTVDGCENSFQHPT